MQQSSSIFKLGIIAVLSLFAASCANTSGMSTRDCVVAGALIGGGAGTAAGDKAAQAISAGAILGGLAGAVICNGWGDADGDGVRDKDDKCPNTRAGVAVDATGCPIDSDGDGVSDDRDRCPNTPRGRVVDANGCEKDSDGDGVVDGLDKCPGTAKGVKVDGKGCPVPQTIVMTDLDMVNFEFDSARLTSGAQGKLDGMVQTLKSTAPRGIKVVGHTDSTGPESYNQKLSERRAASVVDYLASKGVSRDRLQMEGKGESMPLVANDTKENRATNRRVELELK
ncbi:MAG: OmpA family protein [Pseudomonadota bacterium]|nr:OmpA family protein [Pseudomonadota bacterium]